MLFLSEHSERLLWVASEEASALGQDRFDTGHLTIAVLRFLAEGNSDQTSTYSNVLSSAREAMIRMRDEDSSSLTSSTGPTNTLILVFEDASKLALNRTWQKFIRPSDLLEAMSRRADSAGNKILETCDISVEQLIPLLKEQEVQQRSSLTSAVEGMAEFGEEQQFVARHLKRVVPIDQKQANSGIIVALTALEVYVGGVGLLRYLVSASPEKVSKPSLFDLTLEDMRAWDRFGRPYQLVLKEASGGKHEASGLLAVFGPLDRNPGELHIEFRQISSEGIIDELSLSLKSPEEYMSGRSWEGPWSFHFSI